MAIGAARVMAAGKAGLESLPFFVDELLAQGIPQLAPWAIDHSQDQIDELHDRTRERVAGSWKDLFDIGVWPPGITMDTDTGPNRRLLQLENPLATEAMELADSPAQLGAWCRRNISSICRDTEMMWERYKAREGLTSSYHLSVIIPFCPEGPTSGTVGMYLGAALRQHFYENGKAGELVVWGIELCPPIEDFVPEMMNRLAVQNAFRGYVARDELIKGVPLSDEANDTKRRKAFDINIVFDGGKDKLATASDEKVWQALDRAAAQVTACVLNGAGGGDKSEATVQLKQGKRWNAYLAHVVSELDYEQAARYLKYRVTLPWHRDWEAWDAASVTARRDAFLHRIDNDIAPRIQYEQNEVVRKQFEDLIAVANEIRAIPLAGRWNDFLTKNRAKALERVDERLASAVRDDEHNYRDAVDASPSPEQIRPKGELFCINLALPEKQRLEAAQIQRDNGNSGPIADVLGDAGIVNVRGRLNALCEQVLQHPDRDPVHYDSDAFFDEVMSISVFSGGARRNDGFRPAREQLSYFIAADRRSIPGSFSELDFDLEKVVPAPRSGGDSSSTSPALMWRPDGVAYDVPVEYSILTLARVREVDGAVDFKDVSTYDALYKTYMMLKGDLERWREHARYYGVKPPPELLTTERHADLPASPPAAPPSANGQEARVAAGERTL